MTANPTEVMTEDATMKAGIKEIKGLLQAYPDLLAISVTRSTLWDAIQSFDRLASENASLRSSRDEADDSTRKLFKELCPDVGGPEKDCVQTLIAFAREWHGLWKAEEAKVARLEGERDKAVKERNEWREACQQNAEAIDLIHGAFQSEVPARDGEKYSSYAEWGVRAGKRALELIAERDAARAEVSRLSGELASRPAKELVEARVVQAAIRVVDEKHNAKFPGEWTKSENELADAVAALRPCGASKKSTQPCSTVVLDFASASPTPAPAPSDGAPGAAKKDHLQEGEEKVAGELIKNPVVIGLMNQLQLVLAREISRTVVEVVKEAVKTASGLAAMNGGAK